MQKQFTLQQIANKYNVDKSTISNIKRKKIMETSDKVLQFPNKNTEK